MIPSIITLAIGAGLLWLPNYLSLGPDWVQIGGVILATLCGVLAVALFFDWTAHEIISLRRAHYVATEGVKLGYANQFVQALSHLTTKQTMELFRLAILSAHGLPGIPVIWRIEFPKGPVGLSVVVAFLDACTDIYTGDGCELWPVRDHYKERFGADAENDLRIITDWLVQMNLANPAMGNRAATWAIGTHPLDVKRGMGLEE